MIKRTLYFGNPAYLSMKLGQLAVRLLGNGVLSEANEPMRQGEIATTIPIEDIGIVVLDNRQITITQGLLETLLENNCAVITCNSQHLPVGLLLPLRGNTTQNERFRQQLDASLPLKKQLWQQTVQAKIHNQAAVLHYVTGTEHDNMKAWANSVRSGDPDNMEARAAVYYWKTVFPEIPNFIRDQTGDDLPNSMLNYGYAILRAIIARSLVGSGLLPTLGIHHHNRYNAYCLADDIMEPYRPYVDKTVIDIVRQGYDSFTKEIKAKLLSIATVEITINVRHSPLMVAASFTTASLAKCFSGEVRKLCFPRMEHGAD